MAHLRRRPYTIPLPEGAKIITIKGKSFAEFRTKRGKLVRGELTQTRKGQRVRLLSRRWYGEFYDPTGRLHVVPLYTDQAASQMKLADLIKRAERGDAGVADPFEEHRKRPLADHLEDFKRFLTSKGNTDGHARKTGNRVKAILDGCGFTFVAHLSPSAVVDWLALQRTQGTIGIQTSNYYLRDMKAFCRWLVKDRRTGENPLAHLSGMNANTESHRERRALPPEDFCKLIQAARLGGTSLLPGLRLPGPDRAMLYVVAAYVGFRASELASLTPESFSLGDKLGVTVEAAYSKRRRKDTQPLRADLAELLRDYLATKEAGKPVWPGEWWKEAAKMMKADLEAAGLAYVDDAGRVFDFHALRHQFISNLAAAGVHPKVAQILARHSTITLTMDRYTHFGLFDQAAALDNLPDLPKLGPVFEVNTLAATGTHGKSAGAGACAEGDGTPQSVRTHEAASLSFSERNRNAKTAKPTAFANACAPVIMGESASRPRGGMADTGDLKSPGE